MRSYLFYSANNDITKYCEYLLCIGHVVPKFACGLEFDSIIILLEMPCLGYGVPLKFVR